MEIFPSLSVIPSGGGGSGGVAEHGCIFGIWYGKAYGCIWHAVVLLYNFEMKRAIKV